MDPEPSPFRSFSTHLPTTQNCTTHADRCRSINPFHLPGYLVPSQSPISATSSYVFSRHPSSKDDIEIPSISRAILQTPNSPDLEWLNGKVVLALGDSIDRNGITHLGAEVLKGKAACVIDGSDGSVAPSLDGHHIRVHHQETLNFTAYNFFLKGVAATSTIVSDSDSSLEEPFFLKHGDSDRPLAFNARIDPFLLPLIDNGKLRSPDVVVFNAGLWDLMYFGRRAEEEAKTATGTVPPPGRPLNGLEMSHHRERLRSFIRYLQNVFPDARLVYRTMHLSTHEAEGQYLSSRRIVQLSESSMSVLREFEGEGVWIMDWGKKVAGLEDDEMDDRPVHFGPGAANWLYGEMMLWELRQHVLGDSVVWGEYEGWERVRLPEKTT